MSSTTTYLLIFASALLLALGSTPVFRWLAPRLGFMDTPSSRKVHQSPVPRLGGMAIFAAFVVALVLFQDRFYLNQLVSIFLGATMISFLGLWDDRKSLPAGVKLVGQMVAAGIVVLTDVSISLFPFPVMNYVATILWFVGITNAMNLLDNMDGLSAGVATTAAGFFFLLAAHSGQFLVGGLTAAMLGACIGFLFYNLNPARIFMGDSGSLFIGFMLAAIGLKLRFPLVPTTVSWLIPVLVLGLPIFDTALVFISRLRRRCNPLTTPGRDHLSHRLVERGMTQREAVLTLCLTSGLLGGVAMFVSSAGMLEGVITGSAVVLAGLYLFWKFEWKRRPAAESLTTIEKSEDNEE